MSNFSLVPKENLILCFELNLAIFCGYNRAENRLYTFKIRSPDRNKMLTNFANFSLFSVLFSAGSLVKLVYFYVLKRYLFSCLQGLAAS